MSRTPSVSSAGLRGKAAARAGARWFAAVCGCLLALLVAEHGGRMERVAFTTHDDLTCDLSAAEVRVGGLPVLWRKSGEAARGQGRIGYYATYALALAPYMVDSDGARAAVVTGVHVLSIAALAGFLGLYLGWVAALLVAAAIYALLPHWWQHFPIAAYPVQFHAAVLLFFAAAILLVLTVRVEAGRGRAWACRAAAGVLLVPALAVYEASALLFGVTLALALGCEWRNAAGARRGRAGATAVFAAAVFGVYGGAYIAFRMLHPSTYAGNQVSGGSLLNAGAAVRAVVAYAAGGLPLAHLYRQAETVSRFSAASVFELGWVRFLPHIVTLTGMVEAALFTAAAGWFVLRAPGFAAGRRAVWVLMAALGMAVLAPAPIAVVARYQEKAWAITPYVPGYFSYLCFAVALCCGLAAAGALVRRAPGAVRAAVLAPAAAGLFAAVALTQGANDAIVRSQEAHYDTWRLARVFMRSEAFERLPEDAVIVAPGLWDGLSPEWPYYDDYWGKYFAAHSGRRMRVVRQAAAAGGPRYNLEVQRPVYPGRAVLVFQKIGADGRAQWSVVVPAEELKR